MYFSECFLNMKSGVFDTFERLRIMGYMLEFQRALPRLSLLQCSSTYREPKMTTIMNVIQVPMQPERTRVMGCMYFLPPAQAPYDMAPVKATAPKKAPMFRVPSFSLASLFKRHHCAAPPWALHDQDVVMMAGQERNTRVQDSKCFMPSEADAGIVAFNKWLAIQFNSIQSCVGRYPRSTRMGSINAKAGVSRPLIGRSATNAVVLSEPLAGQTPVRGRKDIWRSTWVPVSPVWMLDDQRPTEHTLPGEELVVWWSGPDQGWSVFNNVCPHRQVSSTVCAGGRKVLVHRLVMIIMTAIYAATAHP